ncbi:MAG TPA: 2-isopropylmalate synthase [Tyzzerella sp.]|nr:2-isopropylmalate synthase [Tyzzerella sp.]
MNYTKYRPYPTMDMPNRKWPNNTITKAPVWCSVDMRDGNQSLEIPMNLPEKLKFFQFLVDTGFKEIEIGFPAASDTEFEFARCLIDNNLIPDDVTVQVLTQSRPHIIHKTFEALKGAKKAIVHLYNSTSTLQRDVVFGNSMQETIDLAVAGAKQIKEEAAAIPETEFFFEYSPESFTGTEMPFAVEICNAVLDVWEPTPDHKAIINLPSTVEMATPNIYADQIEYCCENLKYRNSIYVSLHAHNDRGTAVAATELAMLAGADRVEGTLFGNGERTGNTDIMNVAMNIFSQGIDPELDFSHIDEAVKIYEESTRMSISPRHPYAGSLVYTAFSGSHQDAIAKGMLWRETHDCDKWTVPYLPIDPKDLGREYEADVIRINSQSGKGGIGFLLEKTYGIRIPTKMREEVGYSVKDVSDHTHKELQPKEVLKVFNEKYVNICDPIELLEVHFKQEHGGISTEIILNKYGVHKVYHGKGNGRLDAVSNALKRHSNLDYTISTYEEHALKMGSNSQACAYVAIYGSDGNTYWGVGIDDDIINASVKALISSVNRYERCEDGKED